MKKIIQQFITTGGIYILAAQDAFAKLQRPSSSYGLVNQTSASSLILTVVKWVLSFTGTLAVLMIVVAGVMYITAAGDGSKAEKAKDMLTYAITGLVIALLGYAIVLIIGRALNGYGSYY